MTVQNLTGYPSIDKPWLKYYTEEAVNAPLPEDSIYDYMARGKRQHPDCIALDYFGRKISYGQFLDHIDHIAKNISHSGKVSNDFSLFGRF